MKHTYVNESYDSYEELREIKQRAAKNAIPYPRCPWRK